jgi:hypothetical protein
MIEKEGLEKMVQVSESTLISLPQIIACLAASAGEH